MKVLHLISPTWPPDRCGVADYTGMLARELAGRGPVAVLTGPAPGSDSPGPSPPVAAGPVAADDPTGQGDRQPGNGPEVLRPLTRWGRAGVADLLAVLAGRPSGPVLIQYSPFLFSPRGFDPWILTLVRGLAGQGRRTVMVLHELFEPLHLGPVAFVRGGFQLGVLGALTRLAGGLVVTSAERYRLLVDRLRAPRDRVRMIPVGSNIPVQPWSAPERDAWRTQHRLDEGTLAILLFGMDHPSKALGLVPAIRDRLLDLKIPHHLFSLGSQGPALTALPGLPAGCWTDLGFLPDAAVSRALRGCDAALLPYVDGASTRRGSLMACLDHGLPIVTTHGPNTALDLLTSRCFLSSAPDDPRGCADELARLHREPGLGTELARAARRYYDASCSWPVIADAIEVLLE